MMVTGDNRERPTHGSVYYGERFIPFTIEPRTGHGHKVRIKVYADKRVVVQAPLQANYDDIIEAAQKRARWIQQQLIIFSTHCNDVLPRLYVSGESHFYLGRRHLLKVTVDRQHAAQVKLLQGVLQVYTPSAEKTRTLLMGWYKQRANDVFDRRLEALLDKIWWLEDKPAFTLRMMQTQWGNCSPAGVLTLNPHLVKAPTPCIDYVLLHEICHIAEHNHSQQFYRLVEQIMPQWQSVKTRLDNMAYFYLNDA